MKNEYPVVKVTTCSTKNNTIYIDFYIQSKYKKQFLNHEVNGAKSILLCITSVTNWYLFLIVTCAYHDLKTSIPWHEVDGANPYCFVLLQSSVDIFAWISLVDIMFLSHGWWCQSILLCIISVISFFLECHLWVSWYFLDRTKMNVKQVHHHNLHPTS